MYYYFTPLLQITGMYQIVPMNIGKVTVQPPEQYVPYLYVNIGWNTSKFKVPPTYAVQLRSTYYFFFKPRKPVTTEPFDFRYNVCYKCYNVTLSNQSPFIPEVVKETARRWRRFVASMRLSTRKRTDLIGYHRQRPPLVESKGVRSLRFQLTLGISLLASQIISTNTECNLFNLSL